MNITTKLLPVALLSFVVGCNQMQTNSGPAMLFADVKEPVAFNNGVSTSKTGKACQESLFGLFATGDASIEKAKQNGGITKIATIDITRTSVLVYGKACTVVKGE